MTLWQIQPWVFDPESDPEVQMGKAELVTSGHF